MSMMSRTI